MKAISFGFQRLKIDFLIQTDIDSHSVGRLSPRPLISHVVGCCFFSNGQWIRIPSTVLSWLIPLDCYRSFNSIESVVGRLFLDLLCFRWTEDSYCSVTAFSIRLLLTKSCGRLDGVLDTMTF